MTDAPRTEADAAALPLIGPAIAALSGRMGPDGFALGWLLVAVALAVAAVAVWGFAALSILSVGAAWGMLVMLILIANAK